MGGLVLLAICVLASSIPGLAEAQPSTATASPGFPTPEDAVRHFVDALVAGDFDGAMAACSIEEQADGFDFPGYIDRVKTHMMFSSPAPSTSDLYRDLDAAATLGSLANQTKMLVYSFFVTEGLDGQPLMPADRAYAEEFQKAVDPSKLADLELVRIDPPMKRLLWTANNINNFNKMANLYGAETMTERIALYELDGQTFVGGFGLYRYESGWKIFKLNSTLAGTSATGAAMSATLEDYEGML
jgi:hypothetical protein